MREPKLVIWDLDETLVRGVWAEGDRELNDGARELLETLHSRGILQAIATQNDPEIGDAAVSHYGWRAFFQAVHADHGPKHRKIEAVLSDLDIDASHAVFVDEDPFERDSAGILVPSLTACSVSELRRHVAALDGDVTSEARRRPGMYTVLGRRRTDEQAAEDYETFLHECDIRASIRPFAPSDELRAIELLRRTNRMNLGSGRPPEEIVTTGSAEGEPRLIVAELRDRYGDFGRCGLLRVTPGPSGVATIDSIAISCRVRARGLSLALLVGMLRHSSARFPSYRLTFRRTERNRPLRMLLFAAGFRGEKDSDELRVDADSIEELETPPWLEIRQVEGTPSGVR